MLPVGSWRPIRDSDTVPVMATGTHPTLRSKQTCSFKFHHYSLHVRHFHYYVV